MSRLFALIIGHAFADFVFQSDSMAKGKNLNYKTTPPIGAIYQPTWVYWLTAHSLVHGGTVWIITQNIWLGLAETICHWLIDFGKCKNWYGIHQDQSAHIICKLVWALF